MNLEVNGFRYLLMEDVVWFGLLMILFIKYQYQCQNFKIINLPKCLNQ